MTYLAIARKYRPATFDEIVGQAHVTRTLCNAIERDRIHHAYLFSGARGVGKTTAARALAKSLNCQEGPTSSPCGSCNSCVEIGQGSSPDLIEIDGASNNSVEDIRGIRDSVHFAPAGGKRKIYLVDEVHMLSRAAFNALLKTLEEPPPHIVFIFATTEPQKIPDTILSRVQRFDFKRIPATGVVERLAEIAHAEGATISEASLRRIARAGEGSMRDAQSLLDKVISFAGPDINDEEAAEILGLIDRGLLTGMLKGLLDGDHSACLQIIDRVHGFGFDLSQFTGELMDMMRDVTLLTLSESSAALLDLPDEEIAELRELATDVAPSALSALFQAMTRVEEEVARASRPRLHLEMAIARLATLRPGVPLTAMVNRLESLERRLRQSGATPASGLRRRGQERRQRATSRRTARRAPPRDVQTEAPPQTSTRAALPSSTPISERLAAFMEGLESLKPPRPTLLSPPPQWTGAAVVYTRPEGRSLAEARREARHADVEALLNACFGPKAVIKFEPSLASRSDTEHQSMEQQVRQDPAVVAIIKELGLKLVHIESDAAPEAPHE